MQESESEPLPRTPRWGPLPRWPCGLRIRSLPQRAVLYVLARGRGFGPPLSTVSFSRSANLARVTEVIGVILRLRSVSINVRTNLRRDSARAPRPFRMLLVAVDVFGYDRSGSS